MLIMTRTTAALWICVAIAVVGIGPQSTIAGPIDFSSPPPNILPPPPPPPPPPKIEVPRVPRMDEIPSQPKAALPTRSSFKARITRCIEEGAAMGLSPNERAAYSRACANQ